MKTGQTISVGFISDLHTRHNEWFDNLQYGQWGNKYEQRWKDLDILIFAGDCSSRGYFHEIADFTNWFSKQPAKHKVMIAGNHDFGFEKVANFDENKPRSSRENVPSIEDIIPDNITYLNDEGTEILGLKIWGSPIQPWFHNWAFNRQRGKDIKKHWDMIPNDTDILITHGPPKGFGDLLVPKFQRSGEDPHVGCQDLLEAIERVKPKINVFGHIHEGYGKTETTDTTFINASCLDDNYSPVNPPIILDIEV
jgi:Icc-related predicted phosphoesterase